MSEEAATVAQIDLALVDDCIERFFAVSSARARRFGRPSEELWRVLRRASMGGKRFRPAWSSRRTPGSAARTPTRRRERRRGLRAAPHRARRARRRHRPRLVAPRGAERRRVLPRHRHDRRPGAAHRRAPRSQRRRDRGRPRPRRCRTLRRGVRCHRRPSRAGCSRSSTTRCSRVPRCEMTDVDLALGVMPTRRRGPGHGAGEDERYSFEAPLQSVAVLAGADESVVEALGAFGREIGIAYQIVDDLLGVYGDDRDRQVRARRPARGQAHHAHRLRRDHRLLGRHRALPR